MDFTKLIQEEGVKLRELHAAIHRTFVHRDRDSHSNREWSEACSAFHSYVSSMDRYLERACDERHYADQELLEFVICFLEVDPWFFRSGYLKQAFITRLKRSELDAAAKRRLRRVLVDAVNRRGTREFKHYCHLAVVLATEEIIRELGAACIGNDAARCSRARMMLKHINRDRTVRVLLMSRAGDHSSGADARSMRLHRVR